MAEPVILSADAVVIDAPVVLNVKHLPELLNVQLKPVPEDRPVMERPVPEDRPVIERPVPVVKVFALIKVPDVICLIKIPVSAFAPTMYNLSVEA